MPIAPHTPPADAQASPGSSPATCRCGHDRHHPAVRAEPKYGVGSWLRLMVGVSARPERIAYRCRRCDAVIEETTESQALDASY